MLENRHWLEFEWMSENLDKFPNAACLARSAVTVSNKLFSHIIILLKLTFCRQRSEVLSEVFVNLKLCLDIHCGHF